MSIDLENRLVLENLDKICLSAEFARSERMISFLRVIVHHALSGNKHLLTERFVGQVVFGRPADWDPSVDTIVRSEARRLRSKIELYYQGAGQQDTIQITMPKGGYAPQFARLHPVELARAIQPSMPGGTHIAHRRLIIFPVMGVLAFALLWLGYRQWRGHSTDASLAQNFSTSPFISDVGREYSPAISPDGKRVAYVWETENDPPDIFLKSSSDSAPVRMSDSARIRLFPAWSPDGTQLAYLEVLGDDVAVMTHSLKDGTERRVTRISKQVGRWSNDNSPLLGPPGPVWTADGQSLIIADHDASGGPSGIFRVALDGHRSLFAANFGEDHDLYPRLSPDGSMLAYLSYSSHGVGDVFVKPIQGGEARQLTFDRKTVQGLAWNPDGKHLVFASNRRDSFQIWSFSLVDGRLTSIPTNSSSATEPTVAPSGDSMVYVEAHDNWN
jgi:Tol biopolymer transport system component